MSAVDQLLTARSAINELGACQHKHHLGSNDSGVFNNMLECFGEAEHTEIAPEICMHKRTRQYNTKTMRGICKAFGKGGDLPPFLAGASSVDEIWTIFHPHPRACVYFIAKSRA